MHPPVHTLLYGIAIRTLFSLTQVPRRIDHSYLRRPPNPNHDPNQALRPAHRASAYAHPHLEREHKAAQVLHKTFAHSHSSYIQALLTHAIACTHSNNRTHINTHTDAHFAHTAIAQHAELVARGCGRGGRGRRHHATPVSRIRLPHACFALSQMWSPAEVLPACL